MQKKADITFYLKVRVDGDQFAHIRIVQMQLPVWPPPLYRPPAVVAVQYVKELYDPLQVFEENQFTQA